MKTMEICVLSVLLSMAAHGGISDALGASGKPASATPVPPTTAANPPSPGTPPGRPRNPNATPMPAPAPTDHYAGWAGNPK